jgi:TrpR-related protein YerC/YecD
MKNRTYSLISAILALKTSSEARRFLRDLLTEKEIKEFENRWAAAQMLDQSIPYSQIIAQTGLSSTTVARIAKWLNGTVGGYRLALKRLAKHHHSPDSSRGSRLR